MGILERAVRPDYFKSQCDILNLNVTRFQSGPGGGCHSN